MKLALGVDIGGTNSKFGLVDENGELHYSNSIKTDSAPTPNLLVNAIYDDISKNTKLLEDIGGIGIGAPNGNYFSGSIEFAPNLHWKGIIPLASIFEQRFGVSSFNK